MVCVEVGLQETHCSLLGGCGVFFSTMCTSFVVHALVSDVPVMLTFVASGGFDYALAGCNPGIRDEDAFCE